MKHNILNFRCMNHMVIFLVVQFFLSIIFIRYGSFRINKLFLKSGLTKHGFGEMKKDRNSDLYKKYKEFVRIIVFGFILLLGSFIILVAPSFWNWIISYFY
jgi:hypothetical protein